MRFRETQSLRSARLEGWAAPWFETPRTRLRDLGGLKIAAPHHEAERGRECIKLIGIRFSAPLPKFVIHRCNLSHELRKQKGH